MTNLSNVSVNDTHMCVLRKVESENRVKVDFVELKFEFQEQLNELELMANNPNRTVLELQDYVKNSPLRVLERDYNFCNFLDGTYQWMPVAEKISIYDYQSKIAEFEKNKDDSGKSQYTSDKRQAYFNSIKRHVLPYMLQEKYRLLNNDPTVLAYSHRRVGWAAPSFNLNEDLRVDYLTNFGYGMSSYFFTQIYYKGIGILPYSEWVHYYYASTSDIIRYTRRHLLENREWINVMDITAEIYNYAMSNPEDFVKKYIINEVEEMVSGLENILKSSSHYRILYSFFNKNKALYLEGDDLIRFKGEKISGALNFLDQLCRLTSVCGSVAPYIKRIMNCNISVATELGQAIDAKSETLQELESKIKDEQPKWDVLNTKNEKYERERSEMWDTIKKEKEFAENDLNAIRVERDARFTKEHPEYAAFKMEYDTESKVYYDLRSKRGSALSFIKELQSYLDRIEAHKKYIEENNIAA